MPSIQALADSNTKKKPLDLFLSGFLSLWSTTNKFGGYVALAISAVNLAITVPKLYNWTAGKPELYQLTNYLWASLGATTLIWVFLVLSMRYYPVMLATIEARESEAKQAKELLCKTMCTLHSMSEAIRTQLVSSTNHWERNLAPNSTGILPIDLSVERRNNLRSELNNRAASLVEALSLICERSAKYHVTVKLISLGTGQLIPIFRTDTNRRMLPEDLNDNFFYRELKPTGTGSNHRQVNVRNVAFPDSNDYAQATLQTRGVTHHYQSAIAFPLRIPISRDDDWQRAIIGFLGIDCSVPDGFKDLFEHDGTEPRANNLSINWVHREEMNLFWGVSDFVATIIFAATIPNQTEEKKENG
jgi:hypothetical protein